MPVPSAILMSLEVGDDTRGVHHGQLARRLCDCLPRHGDLNDIARNDGLGERRQYAAVFDVALALAVDDRLKLDLD